MKRKIREISQSFSAILPQTDPIIEPLQLGMQPIQVENEDLDAFADKVEPVLDGTTLTFGSDNIQSEPEPIAIPMESDAEEEIEYSSPKKAESEFQPTGSLGFRRTSFNIPISSIKISVGVHNMHDHVASRGLPSLATFHECGKGKRTQIGKPAWCDKCGRKVEDTEVIKGYKLAKDEYVFIEKDRVDQIKESFDSEDLKVIGITKFNLVPEHVYDTYVLLPPKSDTKKGERAAASNANYYALLADKLKKDGLSIIGKSFTSSSEHFIAITGREVKGTPILWMYSLYYADEIRSPDTMAHKAPKLAANEIGLMSNLVDKMTGTVDFGSINSETKDIFEELIKKAIKGKLPPVGKKLPELAEREESETLTELRKALAMAAPSDDGEKTAKVAAIAAIAILGIAFLFMFGRMDSMHIEQVTE